MTLIYDLGRDTMTMTLWRVTMTIGVSEAKSLREVN